MLQQLFLGTATGVGGQIRPGDAAGVGGGVGALGVAGGVAGGIVGQTGQLRTIGGDPLVVDVRITVDQRTNSIIAAGSPFDLLRINAIIARLEDAAAKALQAPLVKERLAQMAAEPVPVSSSGFQKYFEDDVERFARLVREGKLKPLQ